METIPLTPMQEMAADVLTGAVEGGTGYWAQVSHIDRQGVDGGVIVAVTFHPEEYGDFEPLRLGLSDVLDGMRLIAEGGMCNKLLTGQVRRLLKDPQAHVDGVGSDYDADTCDVIVQAAMFGRIVYG